MGNILYKNYKYKLFPTIDQALYFDKCIEISNWVYNWALNIEETQYKLYIEGKSDKSFIREFELDKLLTQLRKEDEWISSIPVTVERGAIRDLLNAYNCYFESHNSKSKFIFNHPVYKSESNKSNSFYTRSERFYIDHDRVRINGLPMFEMVYIGFDSGFCKEFRNYENTRVSKDIFNNFWITFSIKMEPYVLQIPQSEPIGIDINARKDSRIVLSNGFRFEEPPELERAINGVRDSRIELSYYIKRRYEFEKQNPGQILPQTANELKVLDKFKKRNAHVSNITKTFYHTAIKQIIMTNPAGIVIEDLNVIGMLQDHYVADDIFHACFGLFKEIMLYECIRYNIPLFLAPPEFKSTKICSNCGFIHEKFTTHQVFICPNCKLRIDRDLNSAINLKQLYFGK